ncbi:hypothetical protein B0H63DRAFT_565001 [Podospora didyma]|uniref:Tat pathway signal sequence n=1 Tax=Podospora didyma TaxID=330526 RepID=A0AAE0K1K5_9PEZI|nr:hypothetical protein B0H63DRAFT_565001 [Podospora didyma]
MEKVTSKLPFARQVETYERLLDSETSDTDSVCIETSKEVPRPRTPIWRRILVCITALYIIASATALVAIWKNHVPEPYSPANHLISYHRQPLYFGEDEKFTGAPQDVDAAWDHLLEPINIAATEEELRQAHADFTNDMVQLVDGDYVAVLSVHHELHCLDALRRNIFADYYYPNATAEVKTMNVNHMTHCVDTIRRSLMCKADVSIYTAYWIGDHTAPISKELRSNSDTVCVNWDAIDGWARERLLEQNKYLVRPGPYEKIQGEHSHSHDHEHNHEHAGRSA